MSSPDHEVYRAVKELSGGDPAVFVTYDEIAGRVGGDVGPALERLRVQGLVEQVTLECFRLRR